MSIEKFVENSWTELRRVESRLKAASGREKNKLKQEAAAWKRAIRLATARGVEE